MSGSTENRTQSYSFSDYRAYLIYTSDPYTVTLLKVRGFTVFTGGRSGIRTHTLLINSQLLYRWSYSPSLIVSIIGLKPITSWVVTKCSIHLSYMDILIFARVRGFEPLSVVLETNMLPLHHTRMCRPRGSRTLVFEAWQAKSTAMGLIGRK